MNGERIGGEKGSTETSILFDVLMLDVQTWQQKIDAAREKLNPLYTLPISNDPFLF